MKITLKGFADPAASDAPAAPPPQDGAAAPAPKMKIKISNKGPAPGDGENGDASQAKRKYTKKVNMSGPKKRAREDGDDADRPAGKRKLKPTEKSLMADMSDDDEEPLAQRHAPAAPRQPPIRNPSLKLSIKPKGAVPGAPQRTGTTLVKLKGAGKPPVRPPGVGYDSEADEAEADPAIESQFILRMPPGDDCDLLRKAIEEKKIGVSVAQGGPGVQFRFFDREGRRAMITIQGRNYAASMVELPTVVETMKSWNKKDWVKTADVCQMLLVLGQVQNEEEAKKYPRPGLIEPDSHRFPHGITPPMRWARKLRFRPRKSYLDVERAEAQMNKLLAEDEVAQATKYELVDSDHESDESESEDEEMPNAPEPEGTPVEEVDADLLEQMLAEGLVDEDDVQIEGDPETISALLQPEDPNAEPATPATAHEVALHALQQNGTITLETETAASTPAAATSADDDDDDDDDDSDEEDDVDDAAVAEEQRKEQLRREIAELDEAIESSMADLQKHTNKLYKQRVQTTIDKQKADRDIKRKQLGEDADMDE
jgi:transcription initiation factor TFIID subunit 7